MDVLEPFSVFPFPTDCYMLYRGIAFDGCFFYLTMPKNHSICKFNTDFEQIGLFEVNKPYSCICYDNTENCFWASVDNITVMIFKLDSNMKEIDFIRINAGNRSTGTIKGLSYNCENNTLVAAFKYFIAEIQKDGNTNYLKTAGKGFFSGVVSVAPYFLSVLVTGSTQAITISALDGSVIKTFCFPDIYRIEDLLFYPGERKDKKHFILYILAVKHRCYPRLLKCNLEGCNINPCFCNYEGSVPCRKSKDQYATDLIESIALEETALSSILNELGAKLQKTTRMADNICDLLEVNKAVNKTIMNITQLEHILYAKLETINSIKCSDCGEDPGHGG